MTRLSSNWTLFLKIFLPIFWISFFGGFAIAAFVSNKSEVPFFTSKSFQLKIVLFILMGIIFFAFTFFRLKRVDGEKGFVFISNYFRTYRYPVDTINEIVIYDHLIVKAAHLSFTGKSSMGQKIIFIPYMDNLPGFCEENNILIRDFKSSK